MADDLRIGIGFDVHPLVDGRRLILGNVEIPNSKGLEGHSDADVLLHAITDAVLGALCWSDIGTWFPNTDARFKDKDSAYFLTSVWGKVRAEGWRLGNCDCMVLAENPKLQPHIPSMRTRLAELFDCQIEQVSVKATTMERLGFIGREEGIAAQAAVLLRR